MKDDIVECDICTKKMKYYGIGKHYKCSHKINLSDEIEYIKYFNYNYPNFIDNIIKECNNEKKSINILLKEKYNYIGEGTINRLQKILKNKINVTKEDIEKIRTNNRQKTCISKYGNIYSSGFTNNMGGFSDIILASKASNIAKNNPSTKKKRHNYFCGDEFKEKRKNKLIEKYGTLIIKISSTSKWHKRIRKLFIENNIYTLHEKNVVKSYITDEFDENNKVCIELNGDFWHCNPNIFNADFYHPVIKMTASEIWEKDKRKYDSYKENGYNVFIIWESDNINDKLIEYKKIYKYA